MKFCTTAGFQITFRFGLLIAFLFLGGMGAAKSEAQSKGTYRSGSSSSSGYGDGTWEKSLTLLKIEDFGEPDKAAKEFMFKFDPPKLDEFGNLATFSGRMFYRKSGGASPVHWLQGITVLLSIEQEACVSWAENKAADATLSETVILASDGSFTVEFDLRESTRNPLVVEKFQIGVSLAKTNMLRSGKARIRWSSSDRFLTESVNEISVPASPEIPHEIRLIDLACKWPFQDRDGSKLIRAVNALHAQGKEQAIASMRQYLQQSRGGLGESDEIVFWILRSLFEPGDLEERSYRPMIFAAFFVEPKTQRQLWPWDPMDVVDQIPFMLGRQIGGGGVPEHPSSHLDWFEKHGVLRHQPLSPTVNPLMAAEELCTSKKFQTLNSSASEIAKDTARSQALAMVGATPDEDGYFETDDPSWAKYLRSELSTKIWNSENQCFEARPSK